MQHSKRDFRFTPAVRKDLWLRIGLFGPSFSGKTWTALELATGIARVSPGPIRLVDSENGRALLYSDRFKFEHGPLTPPFGPLDYLGVIEQAAKGASVVIVDSMSHEHEGPGGVLDQHDSVVAEKGHAHSATAWIKPKAQRREMIHGIMQIPCHMIFCYRAREKIRPRDRGERAPEGEDKKIIDLGYMPIAGEEMLFELTMRAFFPPAACGVPQWRPEREGERGMISLPDYFRPIFEGKPGPLTSAQGEAMARWARGDASSMPAPATQQSGSGLRIALNYLETLGLDQAQRQSWVRKACGRQIAKWGDVTPAEAARIYAITDRFSALANMLAENGIAQETRDVERWIALSLANPGWTFAEPLTPEALGDLIEAFKAGETPAV